ncbi:MAG: hypothetical protein Hals2KO_35740 [Halioglobus sp.]
MLLHLRMWCFLTLWLPAIAQATDYFVSPGGSDSNNGLTPTAAWQSLAPVNSLALQPGDRVFFEGGKRFAGTLLLDGADAGEAAAPVVISSYGTGRATIDAGTGDGISIRDAAGIEVRELNVVGDGPLKNTGRGIWFYTEDPDGTRFDHIRINRVDVSGFRKGGLVVASDHASLPGYRDVRITHSRFFGNGETGIHFSGFYRTNRAALSHENVYIAHCELFENAGDPTDLNSHTGSGIILNSTDGALIEFNRAHHNGGINSKNSGGPIGIWAWHSNAVVMQYNISDHNRSGGGADGGGFDLDGGMTNSVMQYNYSYENEGAGYLLAQFLFAAPFENNVIRYNVSYSDGDEKGYGGIVLFTDYFESIDDVEIYGNTIVTDSPSAEAVDVFFGFYSNVNFRNNIFLTGEGTPLLRSAGDALPPGLRFHNNLYWTVGGGFEMNTDGKTYGSLTEWRQAGQEMLADTPLGVHTEPGMVSPFHGEALTDPTRLVELRAFRLRPGSAAIDAGLDLQDVFGVDPGPADFFQTPLPQGSGYDLGAAEFVQREHATGIQSAVLFMRGRPPSDNPAQSDQTLYLAVDAAVELAYGSDPAQTDVRLDVTYDEFGTAFIVPAGARGEGGGWAVGDPRGARYINPAAPGGSSTVRRAAIVHSEGLGLDARSLGDAASAKNLAAPPVGSVFTAYTVVNGTQRTHYCSRFPPQDCQWIISPGDGGQSLLCQHGLPDASCAALAP